MRRTLVEIATFLAQSITAWQAYLTGGAIQALISAYERAQGRNISWLTYRWGIAAFLLAAFFTSWRRENRRADTAEQALVPTLNVRYDYHNSLFLDDGETHRLAVDNIGTSTIDDVVVKVIQVPAAAHLNGFLPLPLREQHTESGGPFVINGGSALILDLFEYPYRDDYHGNDGQRRDFLCTPRGFIRAAVMHDGQFEFVIEVTGRNVPACRRRFRATCVTAEGAILPHGTLRIDDKVG